MQELITKITEKAGISAEQATKALDTIKEFVKEKFPMMAGAVDNLLGADAAATTTTTTTETVTTTVTENSIMDKISDVIPGEAGQKVEDFAKNAAHKAEEAFEDVKEKLTGLFSGTKN